MSFEDEHGKGSLAEALEMATFKGTKPVASDDDDEAITFTWDGIGKWRFGYILPNFIFYELWMENPDSGFMLWAATEKIQEVIARFSPNSRLQVVAQDILTTQLADYLVGMGFERGERTEAGGYVYSVDPARVKEWGDWVKAGAKPEEEPAWRVSSRLAGEFGQIKFETVMVDIPQPKEEKK